MFFFLFFFLRFRGGHFGGSDKFYRNSEENEPPKGVVCVSHGNKA